jgi:hypothetical protein
MRQYPGSLSVFKCSQFNACASAGNPSIALGLSVNTSMTSPTLISPRHLQRQQLGARAHCTDTVDRAHQSNPPQTLYLDFSHHAPTGFAPAVKKQIHQAQDAPFACYPTLLSKQQTCQQIFGIKNNKIETNHVFGRVKIAIREFSRLQDMTFATASAHGGLSQKPGGDFGQVGVECRNLRLRNRQHHRVPY